jgi:hypothetical protein
MKEHLRKYFEVWWKPVLTFVIAACIFVFGLLKESKFINDTFDYVIVFLILVVLISAVYQFFIRKWYLGILQILITTGVFFCLSFFLMYYPNDFFADNLKIPDDIEFERPVNLDSFENSKALDSLSNSKNKNLTFKLVNVSQPGIYNYFFWYQPTELGAIFIKAYEITQNQELSTKTLKSRSRIEIRELVDSVVVFGEKFTIYEGDWGKEYGARIEVWFEPKSGKPPYQIIKKNYIIEGWMR